MLRRFRALSRRQKALVVISAGAAGAVAAYYAGSRYLESYVDSLRDADRLEAVQALQTQQQKKEDDEEAETKVTEHFDSIQRIADTTTLPSQLPGLKAKIFATLNVTSLTDTLKRAKEGSTTLSPQEKYAVWEQLKILSFARTLTAAWGVCLLDLFLRVQLNILGSHLYLSSALQAGQPFERRRELSQSSQHAYLSLSNFFPQRGAELLAEKAEAACRTVLTTVPLKAEMTHADLCDLFSLIRDAFKAELLKSAAAAESNGADSHARSAAESNGSSSSPVANGHSYAANGGDAHAHAHALAAANGGGKGQEVAAPGPVSLLWTACLLPPDGSPEADPQLMRAWEQVTLGEDGGAEAGPSGRPDDTSWRTLSGGQSDTELLGCIIRETREVLLSERFSLVMEEMIDVSLEVIAKNVREPFGDAAGASSSGGESEGAGGGAGAGAGAAAGGRGAGLSLPLAKLVPHVASAASDVLAAPNEEPKPGSSGPRGVAAALGKLQMLDSFCADLFSSV